MSMFSYCALGHVGAALFPDRLEQAEAGIGAWFPGHATQQGAGVVCLAWGERQTAGAGPGD